MALHDNPLWILSHIQNSFIVSDNTANSQLILTNDHKPYLAEIAEKAGLELRHEKCLNPFGEDSGMIFSIKIDSCLVLLWVQNDFGPSKLFWMGTNCFGWVQFVLVRLKSFWTGPNYKN